MAEEEKERLQDLERRIKEEKDLLEEEKYVAMSYYTSLVAFNRRLLAAFIPEATLCSFQRLLVALSGSSSLSTAPAAFSGSLSL